MSATNRPVRSHRRLAAAVAGLAVVTAFAAACSDDDPGDDATDEVAPDTTGADGGETDGDGIVAQDFNFTSVTASAGAEVPITNEGSAPHTVTADDDAFDSGQIAGGESGSITAPDEAGEYSFHCEIHPDMTGTLTVEA